jgi:acetoacetate decarboxylase
MTVFDRPFTVPDRTPLFKALPRHYVGYRKLSVFCEASPEGIRKALPADLEYVSNQIEVFVMDCPEVHDIDDPAMGPRTYLEGGVVVQAAYGGSPAVTSCMNTSPRTIPWPVAARSGGIPRSSAR